MKYILLILIKAYKKFLSPLFPNSCRFYPTCSDYAYQVINNLGFFKGLYFAAKRILKCNPFFEGGYDPAPGKHKHIHIHQKNKFDLSKYYEIL